MEVNGDDSVNGIMVDGLFFFFWLSRCCRSNRRSRVEVTRVTLFYILLSSYLLCAYYYVPKPVLRNIVSACMLFL